MDINLGVLDISYYMVQCVFDFKAINSLTVINSPHDHTTINTKPKIRKEQVIPANTHSNK